MFYTSVMRISISFFFLEKYPKHQIGFGARICFAANQMGIVRGLCGVLEFAIVGSEVLNTPMDQKTKDHYAKYAWNSLH